MNFLVTNDDGVRSPFLHELVFALLAAGHTVAVVAPKTEQSWIGAASPVIALFTPPPPITASVAPRGSSTARPAIA